MKEKGKRKEILSFLLFTLPYTNTLHIHIHMHTHTYTYIHINIHTHTTNKQN